jgi:hypothetical protein
MKHLALTLSLLAATTAAQAQGLDLSGTWETDSGSVNGRGGGHITMQATHRNGGLTFTYGGNTMVCAVSGQRCRGTWQGGTGSGWFSITFSSNGHNFSGTWGYGRDRENVGTFSGSR